MVFVPFRTRSAMRLNLFFGAALAIRPKLVRVHAGRRKSINDAKLSVAGIVGADAPA